DSSGGASSKDVEGDAIALKASASLLTHHGTVSRGGDRFAEVAEPYRNGWVLLLSAPLADALDAVSVAKQRILVAGGIVLAAVLVVGYVGAWLFSRRIKRLVRAADRIAAGSFDEPITDAGNDEVGEVARAFEHM